MSDGDGGGGRVDACGGRTRAGDGCLVASFFPGARIRLAVRDNFRSIFN